MQTSLLESSIYALNYVAGSWLNGGYDYTRQGNSHPLISPYTVFSTVDSEYLVIGVATDAQFATFTKVLGLEHLASEPRFITNKARCENNAALHKELQGVIGSWQSAELHSIFKAHGVPFSSINSMKQLFAAPEV